MKGTAILAILFFGLLFVFWWYHDGGLDALLHKEGMRGSMHGAPYPLADIQPLLNDSFPAIKNPHASNETYEKIWWKYPQFKMGSFKQVTNNVRYNYNPDEGTCIPAEMCGALYHNKLNVASNLIRPLGPVPATRGTRVGYYRTPQNLFLGPQPGPKIELPAF